MAVKEAVFVEEAAGRNFHGIYMMDGWGDRYKWSYNHIITPRNGLKNVFLIGFLFHPYSVEL